MSLVLTAARCTVSPERQPDYRRTVQALADVVRARGQRIWIFRHTRDPNRFLEFSEAPAPHAHRARASRTPRESELERRLRELASYEPDAWDLWEEVPLGGDAG